MLFAFAADAGAAVEVVQPALGTLEKSVIGALLIISWAITCISVWQAFKAQNARTQDQKDARESSDKTTAIIITAVTEMKGALDKLTASDENSRHVLNAIKGTLDLLLVMSGGRRLSPPAGIPAVPAPQSEAKER